jgi:hypothetical protein
LSRPFGIHQEIQHERMLDQFDIWIVGDCFNQRSNNFDARGITASMGNPIAMMATFAGEREGAGLVQIEIGTPPHEPTNCGRALVGKDLGSAGITEPGPRNQGICQVFGR